MLSFIYIYIAKKSSSFFLEKRNSLIFEILQRFDRARRRTPTKTQKQERQEDANPEKHILL